MDIYKSSEEVSLVDKLNSLFGNPSEVEFILDLVDMLIDKCNDFLNVCLNNDDPNIPSEFNIEIDGVKFNVTINEYENGNLYVTIRDEDNGEIVITADLFIYAVNNSFVPLILVETVTIVFLFGNSDNVKLSDCKTMWTLYSSYLIDRL